MSDPVYLMVSRSNQLAAHFRRVARTEGLSGTSVKVARNAMDALRVLGFRHGGVLFIDEQLGLDDVFRILEFNRSQFRLHRFVSCFVRFDGDPSIEALGREYGVSIFDRSATFSEFYRVFLNARQVLQHPTERRQLLLNLEQLWARRDFGAAAVLAHRKLTESGGQDFLYEALVSFYFGGRTTEAMSVLDRLDEFGQVDPRIFHLKSFDLVAGGEHAQALKCLYKAQSVSPHHLLRQFLIGVSLLKVGRLDDGLRAFERIQEVSAHSKEGALGLGMAYCLLGEINVGEALLRQVYAHRDLAGVLNSLGLLARELGMFRRARELLKLADFKLGGQSYLRARVAFNLGLVALNQKQLTDSSHFFAKASRFDRYFSAAKLNHTCVHEALHYSAKRPEEVDLPIDEEQPLESSHKFARNLWVAGDVLGHGKLSYFG